MPKELKWDEEAEKIAAELVSEHAKGLEWVEKEDLQKIAFVHKDTKRGKIADIGILTDKMKFLFSYIGKRNIMLVLTTYGWFTDETPIQKRATIHHELLHIDSEGDFEKLLKHDIQEFAIVMQVYPEVKDQVLKMMQSAKEKEKKDKKKKKVG